MGKAVYYHKKPPLKSPIGGSPNFCKDLRPIKNWKWWIVDSSDFFEFDSNSKYGPSELGPTGAGVGSWFVIRILKIIINSVSQINSTSYVVFTWWIYDSSLPIFDGSKILTKIGGFNVFIQQYIPDRPFSCLDIWIRSFKTLIKTLGAAEAKDGNDNLKLGLSPFVLTDVEKLLRVRAVNFKFTPAPPSPVFQFKQYRFYLPPTGPPIFVRIYDPSKIESKKS